LILATDTTRFCTCYSNDDDLIESSTGTAPLEVDCIAEDDLTGNSIASLLEELKNIMTMKPMTLIAASVLRMCLFIIFEFLKPASPALDTG
jgi:hypothetical protein